MNSSSAKRIIILTIAGLAAIALLYPFTPEVNHYQAIPGRPLMEQQGRYFTDEQLGFQFTPPPEWALQLVSTEAPTEHKKERTVVKYKRLARGPKVAWLRVTIGDLKDEAATPAEILKDRKPREASWKVTKEIEDGLSVGGRPAARITFGGMLNPDSAGERLCSCEVTAVRHGPQVLYFWGTFANADPESKKMLREAVDSVVFDRARFVKQ